MTRIAESLIILFTPAYQSFCQAVWGKDLTQMWTEQTGLPWTRIHEHVIFWVSTMLMASLTLNIILVVRKVKIRGEVNDC